MTDGNSRATLVRTRLRTPRATALALAQVPTLTPGIR